MPNGLAISGGVTFPILAPDGSAAAPSYSWASYPASGIYRSGAAWVFTNGDSAGTDGIHINPSVTYLRVVAAANTLCEISNYKITCSGAPYGSIGFSSGLNAGAAQTTAIAPLGDASLRLGLAPSATPIAQTFTIGEASRPGTDVNVGGANGAIRSGLGTGTGTASSLIFQTPTLAASGSTTQTYTTRLTIATASVTSTAPLVVPLGTGAAPGVQGAGGGAGGLWWFVANQACLGDANAYFRSGNGQLFFFANGVGTGECPGVVADYGFRTAYTFNFASAGFNTLSDLWLGRLAAASLLIGGAPSATPLANTLTIGEASRPGTDSNVGGASGTIRSGLGTGTGTASSLIFQTPTLAASGSGTQTYATRLTVATAGVTVDNSIPLTVQSFAVTSQVGTAAFSGDGNTYFGFNASYFSVSANVAIGFTNTNMSPYAAVDTRLSRLAAASLLLGLAPSATPTAQTFTVGESSRGTTDNNVAGANGTIRPGTGTGNAAGASLIFETPTPTASGVVAQAYAQRLSLSVLGATFDIPDQGLRINNQVNGAGASAGTLTNAPSVGNPNFWLPINIAGTVRYFPGW